MIFQNPSTSLNPRQCIGRILELPLKLNTKLTGIEREKEVIQTLRQVGLLREHAEYYPHMLALRQKQRVALSRALILRPKIIIADEILTSLDVSMRSQIINLMLELQAKQDIAYIYVMQPLSIVKHISDKILVMNKGVVVESGNTAEVLDSPLHDVIRRLIQNHFMARYSFKISGKACNLSKNSRENLI